MGLDNTSKLLSESEKLTQSYFLITWAVLHACELNYNFRFKNA